MRQRTSQELNKKFKNKIDNYPPVEIIRTFHAPIERVWEAWSKPEQIKQWWGPETFTCPEAKIDFREGGQYNFAMKEANGKVYWSGGEYQEIIKNKRIIYTDHFTNSEGKKLEPREYNMPGVWPDDLTVTIEFEKTDTGLTKMKLRHEGIPAEMHDDCERGWNSSFDKMQKLVEQNVVKRN